MSRIRGAVFILPFAPLFSWLTARYIARHRERLLPASQPISADDQGDLSGFFSSSLLAETRIVCASVPNPRIYRLIRMLGIEGVLEMSSIGAITLVDLIAYPDRMHRSTLFHELVHAVQYQVLGLPRFADLYVRGFLNHGGYHGIPLERQAYELEERFSRKPKKIFSVEEDVVHRLNSGLL
jgi:hypothetical protein